jgi:aminopeptidase N
VKKRPLCFGLCFFLVIVLLGCQPSPTELSATVSPTRAAAPEPTASPERTEPPIPTESPVPTKAPIPTETPGQLVLHPENLSAGDPYAPELGNRGYDVQQYRLRLVLDPANPSIVGQVTITATTTMEGLEQISLDFVGFEIDEVTADGAPAAFFRQEKKLLIDLPEPMAVESTFVVDIAYNGEPAQEPSIYVPFVSHLGLFYSAEDSLFVVAEPDGARYWFPCNDHPKDKAGYHFELAVPEGLTGVSNGVLVKTDTGVAEALNGRPGDVYVWEHPLPLATAFVTVAVGDYRRVESTSPNGVALRHYVFPGLEAGFEGAQDTIGEMIDWMGDLFGPYPFEAFGYVTVSGLGASLETQTMVILSEGAVHNELTIAHEMVHMWFGDWVCVDSWGDIWRSEGFATYIALMWESRDDPDSLVQAMEELVQRVRAQGGEYPLNDPPPAKMFGSDSYFKGALLVHNLRLEVGDEAFFEGLRTYFERFGGATASHADFQAAIEEAAGISLDSFFEEWFE